MSSSTTSSSSTTINLGQLLSACTHAGEAAGSVIREVWRSGDLQVQDKGDNDPMTQADLRCQQLIVGALHKIWPSLPYIGEEDTHVPDTDLELDLDRYANQAVPQEYKEVNISDVCVFIDPLDATRAFTEGEVECVITLIGIGYNGVAVGGVMHQPFVGGKEGHGRTVTALQGMGVYGITAPEKPKSLAASVAEMSVVTTKSHGSDTLARALELMAPKRVDRVGGCGYKVLQVIEGVADTYVYPTAGTKLWDTCAPEAVLRALGGTLTSVKGQAYTYARDSPVQNTDGIIATLHQNHDLVVTSLAKL